MGPGPRGGDAIRVRRSRLGAGGLAPGAGQHGVTNWEENLGAYLEIGEGLGEAKASPGLVETFEDRLAPTGSPFGATV